MPSQATASSQVKHLRATRGWTQQDLAHAAGMAIKTIWTLESGGRVSRSTLRRVAVALGVDPSVLLDTVEVAS